MIRYMGLFLSTLLKNSSVKEGGKMKINLYQHNSEAYLAALKMLHDHNKAAIIHPTGTGKSFIAFKYAEDHPNEQILWLTPSDYIVKTQLENLQNEGIAALTNITFKTYASLMYMDDGELAELSFDTIIADEFHRIGAERWGEGVKHLIAMHPNCPMLGLSATHIRYLDNQRDMAEELFDGNIASEMTLGEAIVRGILQPPTYIISVYAYQKELQKYEERIDRIVNTGIRDKNKQELDCLRRALDQADGLDVVFKKHMREKYGKYIVFCSNRESMDEMINHADEWFGMVDEEMHIYRVYSDDPSASQDFKDFKADETAHLKLLFCIDMLNEGVHVDNIDGVILLRPTVSPIVYKQQIGRALAAGKKKVPIIFDVVNNFDNLYSISSIQEEIDLAVSYYRDLGESDKIIYNKFTIIDETKNSRELFAQLERSLGATWEIFYQAAKVYYNTHGDLKVPKRYVTEDGITLGVWLSTQRRVRQGAVLGNLSSAQIQMLDEIGMVWDNVYEVKWENGFAHAKEYYEKYGNLDVIATYKSSDGFKLGSWIANNRHWYANCSKKQLLNDERVHRLNKIGMIWNKNNWQWEQNYLAAAEYYRKNGNLEMPINYANEDGVRLGIWLDRQRKLRKNSAKTGGLDKEQIERLDMIGMNWENAQERTWNNNFELAKKYTRKYGNLDIPVGYQTKDGVNLGTWIRAQRSNGNLSEERRRKLESIGMTWEEVDPWEKRFAIAEKYFHEHGDLKISQRTVIDGIWIGKWLYLQRKNKGDLKKEQIKRLESIGMVWENADEWEQGYAHAKNYYKKHGNLDVQKDYASEDGFKLGAWVAKRRKEYRENRLSDKHRNMLGKLGMQWNLYDASWEQAFQAAQEYYNRYGNLNISSAYVDENGFKLGTWVQRQKAIYNGRAKYGSLTEERIKRLENIGINWSNKTDLIWERNFKAAQRYVEEYGNLKIPVAYRTEDGVRLSEWLRGQKKNVNISAERKRKLESIGVIYE